MIFSEQEHSYIGDKGQKYTPVSEFLRYFEKPFEKEAIADATAKKTGQNPQDIINEWELNAEISSIFGTAAHKAVEYWIKYDKVTKIPHLEKLVRDFTLLEERTRIKPEIIVYSDEYKIAGTIDQLIVLKDKHVIVQDLKTNYELDDKKIKKFALQLSTYATLLEMKGFTVDKLLVQHWDGEKLNQIEIQRVDIQPLLDKWKIKISS